MTLSFELRTSQGQSAVTTYPPRSREVSGRLFRIVLVFMPAPSSPRGSYAAITEYRPSQMTLRHRQPSTEGFLV